MRNLSQFYAKKFCFFDLAKEFWYLLYVPTAKLRHVSEIFIDLLSEMIISVPDDKQVDQAKPNNIHSFCFSSGCKYKLPNSDYLLYMSHDM